MYKSRWNIALVMSVVFAVAVACNWSASTANISSLKISKDEDAKSEVSNFGPGDKVYAVAQISNNPGKQSVKFRVLYDDVNGKKSGEMVEGAEKTFDIEGDKKLIFWLNLPSAGFTNGKYKIDVVMSNEQGQQKDQKSSTFTVSGYGAATAPENEN